MDKGLISRIKQRCKELGKSERAVSLEATGKPDTIRMITSGRTQSPRSDTLAAVARILQVTPNWLLTGDEAETPGPAERREGFERVEIPVPRPTDMARDLPVYGTAAGSLLHEGAVVIEDQVADYVRRPPALVGAPEAYGIFITGDSMEPEHRDGDLRFVHPRRPVHIGDTVIVQTRYRDGGPIESYIKHLRRRTNEKIVLSQLNPEAMIEIPRMYVTAIHRVLSMRELYGV